MHLPQKKLASESHAGTSSFFQFLTRFLYGKVASKSPKNTFWGKTFNFYDTVVVLGHFGTTWSILHRASTKNYRRIEASPMALRDLYCYGSARPTQPHYYYHVCARMAGTSPQSVKNVGDSEMPQGPNLKQIHWCGRMWCCTSW
jgi:hypothetical protein